MAVLVDEPRWPWRGQRWSHLVSDVSYAELHDFAHRLGLRHLAFQGDHYDIPETIRDRAIALGAEAVPARELVRRLRAAGLRRRQGKSATAWQLLDEIVPEVAVDRVRVFRRPGEVVVQIVSEATSTEVIVPTDDAELDSTRRVTDL